jgi:hypothetical protein
MRLFWILFLFVVATSAHAFIGGQVPEQAPLPEATEADMAKKQQQAAGATVGELNRVEADTERYDREPLPSDPGAGDTVASVAGNLGATNVVEAGKAVERKPGTPGYVWGFVFAVVGVGCALGLRQWANKALPEPPSNTEVKW